MEDALLTRKDLEDALFFFARLEVVHKLNIDIGSFSFDDVLQNIKSVFCVKRKCCQHYEHKKHNITSGKLNNMSFMLSIMNSLEEGPASTHIHVREDFLLVKNIWIFFLMVFIVPK